MPKTRATKGIYKRGRVYWITYQGLDGKQQFESSRSTLKADAEYLLACRRKEVVEGTLPAVPSRKQYTTTFGALAEKYLEFCRPQRDKTKPLRVEQLKRVFGGVKLAAFNLSMVEAYQGKRLSEPRPPAKGKKEPRPPVRPATVNRELATLKHMFTKAEAWGMIPEQTLKAIRRVKLSQENNRRLRFLSMEESRRLVEVCENHLRPIVVFALHTGCRRGEILGLTWDRVDLKHGFIHLDKTKNGDRRDIPINATLRATLTGIVRRLDSPFVFVNPDTGTRFEDVKRSFATACKKAGIRDFHFHDLRHTFASQLVMAGVDLTTVSRLLGHKSLTMTLRYSHLAPDHLKGAVDVLSRLHDPLLDSLHDSKQKRATV